MLGSIWGRKRFLFKSGSFTVNNITCFTKALRLWIYTLLKLKWIYTHSNCYSFNSKTKCSNFHFNLILPRDCTLKFYQICNDININFN